MVNYSTFMDEDMFNGEKVGWGFLFLFNNNLNKCGGKSTGNL